MEDYIVSATAANTTIRAFAAVTTNTAREAREIHKLSPVAAAALGRTLTAAALMSKSLKGENNSITIQIKGNGPMGGLIAIADSKANVRGYVYRPQIYLPLNEDGKLDVAGAIGTDGYLNVIMDLGLKEPYIGYVNLVSGEIAEDIAYYYAYSEQVPSVVSLGVLVNSDESVQNAGGFFIQLMPDADEASISYLEKKIAQIPPVTTLLSEGKSPEDILEMILGEKDMVLTGKSPCGYQCNCTWDRMERNMISLGPKEIIDLINEQHGAEAQCYFCNKKYYFDEEKLRSLLEE